MSNKFWNFKNKDEKSGELMLYGDISTSTWWGDEVTPKQFKADLDALGDVGSLNIYINSGGGDVFAGQAIHSMLKRHKAVKTVFIDGIAASIASVIAMAGDKIVMPKNAMMMIHNASTIAIGNKETFRKLADDLEKIDGSIVAVYIAKTGLKENEIQEKMDAETWFSAQEAVDQGFADEVEEEKLLTASLDGGFLMLNNQKFDLDRYKNKPKVEISTVPNPLPADNGDENQPVADKLKAQTNDFHRLKTKIYSKY